MLHDDVRRLVNALGASLVAITAVLALLRTW